MKKPELEPNTSLPFSITSKMCHCLRCGHWWMKHVSGRPVRCPHCKQPHWDIPAGVLPRGPVPGKKKAK